jgi:excinuclease ABC subunit C
LAGSFQFVNGAAFKFERIPFSPGIYFFIGKGGKILYIGKAANLRERLRAYFSYNRSEKIIRLVNEAKKLRVQPLESEIAAILEEAKWIKKIRPKYNILLRDDKNYFFVGFTKEQFPKIFITHQPKIGSRKYEVGSRKIEYIGPFVDGRALRKVLKMIRAYFPYCTCRTPHARICLSSQLRLCPGYCCQYHEVPPPREAEPRKLSQYQETIAHIRSVLAGGIAPLRHVLKKKIESASAKQEFELAAKYKAGLEGLEKILSHRGFIETFSVPAQEEPEREALQELAEVLGLALPPSRIEMYDASMISGTNAVGAMVVFLNGKPEKAEWRLFRIKNASPTNDPAMIAETIARRLRHPEWQFPDLILVDGGKAQLAAAQEAIMGRHSSHYPFAPSSRSAGGRIAAGQARKGNRVKIAVAGIAKGPSRKNDRLLRPRNYAEMKFKSMPAKLQKLLTQIRDETHRFAISYHRKSRKGRMLTRDVPG